MCSEQIFNFDESDEQNENRPLYFSYEIINLSFPIINSNNQISYIKEEEDDRHLFTYSNGYIEKNEAINKCSSNESIISSIKPQGDLNENSIFSGIEFDEINKNAISNKLLNSENKNNDTQSKKNKTKKLFFKIKHRIQNLSNTQKVNNMLNKKRQRKKKVYKGTKYMDNYNIKKKLLTHFLNGYICNDNNNIIQKRCIFCFKIFPQNLIKHFIAKERIKELFNMTLKEIYDKKELYDEKNIESHFARNSDFLNNLFSKVEYKDVLEQSGIKEKLGMKISDLFYEYINSDEFKNDIDGLRIESGDAYVEKYSKIAKNL
jgi:hypothetical protein